MDYTQSEITNLLSTFPPVPYFILPSSLPSFSNFVAILFFMEP